MPIYLQVKVKYKDGDEDMELFKFAVLEDGSKATFKQPEFKVEIEVVDDPEGTI